MFFKKRKNKRVICGASAIIAHMQEAIELDIASFLVVLCAGQKHTLGMSSDFELPLGRGKKDKETGRWANVKFHLDKKEFDTFEQFKMDAYLGETLFANIKSGIEVLEVDREAPHIFPSFQEYIITDE